MKLLFVENIANVSYNLAKRLRLMGYDVTLLTRHNPVAGELDLASTSREPWVKAFYVNSLYDKTFTYLLKMLSEKVDIIHCHYALEQGTYALISRGLGRCKKVIVHCHGTDIREISHSRKYGWIVNLNLKCADKTFVSTPDLMRAGTELMPNPIETSSFSPGTASLDLKMNHDFALFCPSRQIWVHKRQDLFLKALRTLVNKGYDCNLVLIDFGPDLDRTKRLIRDLDLEKNVTFVPPIPPADMPAYYNSCDVVWAQMGLGHLGLVTLEALSCNKPTLVDFIYGQAYPEQPPVIKVFSLEDITGETEHLLDLRSFSLDTRWWVIKYHSYEAVLNKLTRVYDELLS